MMTVIGSATCGKKATKTMAEMKQGEVCIDTDSGDFILKVCHAGMDSICLILNNHKGANSYQGNSPRRVRSLMDGESITICFS